jgi:hypothetical protein
MFQPLLTVLSSNSTIAIAITLFDTAGMGLTFTRCSDGHKTRKEVEQEMLNK